MESDSGIRALPFCVCVLCLHTKILISPIIRILGTQSKKGLFKSSVYVHVECNMIQCYVHTRNKVYSACPSKT